MKKVIFVLMAAMLSGCGTAAQSTTPAKTATAQAITSSSAVRAADVAEVVPSLTPKTGPSTSAVPAVTEHPAVILAPKRKVTVAPSVLVAPTVVTCPGPYNIVLTGERCTQPWADGTVHSVPYGELNPEIYGTFVPNPLTITITQLCELYLAPALQGGYAMRPSLAPGVQVPLFGFQIIPSTGAKWWWTGVPVGDPPANDPGVYTVQGWLEEGCGT